MTLGTSPALCGTSVSGGEPEARRRGASFTPSRVQGPSEGADITASNPGAATAVLRRFGLSPPLLEPRFLYLCSRKGNSYPGAAEVSVRNAGGLMIPGTALGYCRWLGTWCVPGRKWHLTCSSAEPCEERLLLSHFSPDVGTEGHSACETASPQLRGWPWCLTHFPSGFQSPPWVPGLSWPLPSG